jgi:predicted nucleotidyltransferase
MNGPEASAGCLELFLGSRSRARLLDALIRAPERDWSIRQLAEECAIDYRSAWSDLGLLRKMGLVEERGSGRARRQRWNRQSPLAPSVECLVNECGAEGVVNVLRRELAPLPWLERAIVFGSRIRARHHSKSDVDVILVGDADEREVHRVMCAIESKLRCTIDYRRYTAADFEALTSREDGFLSSVLRQPYVVVKAA